MRYRGRSLLPETHWAVPAQVLDEYSAAKGESWRAADGDQKDALPLLDTALIKYQVPLVDGL